MVGAASKAENGGRGESMDELSFMHHAISFEHSEGRDDFIRIIEARNDYGDGDAIADENEMRGTSVYHTVAR